MCKLLLSHSALWSILGKHKFKLFSGHCKSTLLAQFRNRINFPFFPCCQNFVNLAECLLKELMKMDSCILRLDGFFDKKLHFSFQPQLLRANYDSSFKVAKKLLTAIFKLNMISTWHLPLKAVFYRFYDVICRHRTASGVRMELK